MARRVHATPEAHYALTNRGVTALHVPTARHNATQDGHALCEEVRGRGGQCICVHAAWVPTSPHDIFSSLTGRCSWIFVLDVLGCFPYDTVTIRIAEAAGVASPTVVDALNWLKLLTLVGSERDGHV